MTIFTDAHQRTLTQSLKAPRELLTEVVGWILAASLVRFGLQLGYIAWLRYNDQPMLPVEALQLLGVIGLVIPAAVAWWLSKRDRPRAAVLIYFVCITTLSALLSWLAPLLTTLNFGMPVLAMILALPFVSRRDLLLMMAASAVALSAAVILPLPRPEIVVRDFTLVLFRITFVLMYSTLMLALVRLHGWLLGSTQRLHALNLSLEAMRATLETQVAERARELAEQMHIAVQARHDATVERDFANIVLRDMTQGIAVVNLSNTIVSVNPACARMLGVSPEALTGKSFFDLFLAEDVARYRRVMEAHPDNAPFEQLMRLRRHDGSVLYVHVHSTAAPSGAEARHVMVVTDLTDQLQADAQRRLLESVIEYAEEPMLILDASTSFDAMPLDDARIIYANRATERLTGVAPSRLVGMTVASLYRDWSAATCAPEMPAAVTSEHGFEIELEITTPEGRAFWAAIHAVPVRDDEGRVTQWIVRLRDITEQREAKQIMQRQHRYLEALQETTLGIFHRLDLGELLTSVMAHVQRLMDTPDAVLVLFDSDTGDTLRPVTSGYWSEIDVPVHRQGEGVVGRIWESGQPLVVNHYAEWPGRRDYVDLTRVHAVAGVPLLSNGAVKGAMIVSRAEPGNPFSAEQVDVLVQFARMVAVAYDNARLYERVREHEGALEAHVSRRTQELLRVLGDNDMLRGQAALVEAQSDRARMVRDLHDSVAQAVYGIALGARALESAIDPLANPSAVEPLRYILSLADAVLLEMRALMFELRPESLRDEGVCAGINIQLDAVRARHGVRTRANLCAEPACDYLIKEAIYRVALECIQNTVKHAHAREVLVTLLRVESGIYLSVEDDGIGFDTTVIHSNRAGLASMRRWVERVGGVLHIVSDLGGGTRVTAEVPLVLPGPETIQHPEPSQVAPNLARD